MFIFILMQTLIHAVNRKTGKQKTFAAEAFFFLHIINQYEEEDHLVIDICCYSDPSMLDCMYIDALKVLTLSTLIHYSM